jgi:hypothetical protein
MAALIVVAGLVAFRAESDRDVSRAKAQAIHEAEVIAEAVAKSNLEVCIRAVTAVTEQLNADMLKTVKTVEDRFVETGRPVPPIYLQLEAQLTNRQPPTAACTPKENP